MMTKIKLALLSISSTVILLTLINLPYSIFSQSPTGDFSMVPIGSVGGAVTAIAVQDSIAYMGVGNRLMPLNINDLTNPIPIEYSLTLSSEILDVTLSNQFAFAATLDNFYLIDITQPQKPIIVSELQLPITAEHIQAEANLIFATDRKQLLIIELSDTHQLRVLNKYDSLEWIYDFKVVNNMVYVATQRGKWNILDISNPLDIKLVTTASINSDENPESGVISLINVTGIDIVDNLAYVIEGRGKDGLQIFDISNPYSPQLVGMYQDPRFANSTSSPTYADIQVVQDLAFVSVRYQIFSDNIDDMVAEELHIFDISDPSMPKLLNDNNVISWSGLSKIFAYDALIFGLTEAGLEVADFTQPDTPLFYDLYPSLDAIDVFIVSNLAYCIGENGLWIANVEDPQYPEIIGHYPGLIGQVLAITVDRTNAYVSAGNGGVQIFDIADPYQPKFAGEYHGSFAKSVIINGELAYINTQTGFDIVNISDPAFPELVTQYRTMIGPTHIELANNLIFATLSSVRIGVNLEGPSEPPSFIQIIDVTDPEKPLLRSEYESAGNARSVVVIDKYAHIIYADESWTDSEGARRTSIGGYRVLDMTDPDNPQLVYYDSEIKGDFLSYIDGQNGDYMLTSDKILDVRDPIDPKIRRQYSDDLPPIRGYDRNLRPQFVEDRAYIPARKSGTLVIQLGEELHSNVADSRYNEELPNEVESKGVLDSSLDLSGKIIFLSDRDYEQASKLNIEEAPFELYVMDPDGTNQHSVPVNRQFWGPLITRPVADPTGNQIAIGQNGENTIRVFGVNGQPLREIQAPAGSAAVTDWSPDGRYLIISSGIVEDERLKAPEIFIYDLELDTFDRFTNNDIANMFASWSPDMSQITYMEDYRLWISDADGGNRRALNLDSRAVSWSPDGSMIAFEGGSSTSKMQIWIVNADGTNPRNLASNLAPIHYGPQWSPDGRKIVFEQTNLSDAAQIYVIDVNTEEITQLTSKGRNVAPYWVNDNPTISSVPNNQSPFLNVQLTEVEQLLKTLSNLTIPIGPNSASLPFSYNPTIALEMLNSLRQAVINNEVSPQQLSGFRRFLLFTQSLNEVYEFAAESAVDTTNHFVLTEVLKQSLMQAIRQSVEGKDNNSEFEQILIERLTELTSSTLKQSLADIDHQGFTDYDYIALTEAMELITVSIAERLQSGQAIQTILQDAQLPIPLAQTILRLYVEQSQLDLDQAAQFLIESNSDALKGNDDEALRFVTDPAGAIQQASDRNSRLHSIHQTVVNTIDIDEFSNLVEEILTAEPLSLQWNATIDQVGDHLIGLSGGCNTGDLVDQILVLADWIEQSHQFIYNPTGPWPTLRPVNESLLHQCTASGMSDSIGIIDNLLDSTDEITTFSVSATRAYEIYVEAMDMLINAIATGEPETLQQSATHFVEIERRLLEVLENEWSKHNTEEHLDLILQISSLYNIASANMYTHILALLDQPKNVGLQTSATEKVNMANRSAYIYLRIIDPDMADYIVVQLQATISPNLPTLIPTANEPTTPVPTPTPITTPTPNLDPVTHVVDNMIWTYYGQGQGIPGAEIHQVLVDEEDQVWIGTSQGLAVSSDGETWTPVERTRGWDVHTFWVRNGKIWIACADYLCTYDGNKWDSVGPPRIFPNISVDGKQLPVGEYPAISSIYIDHNEVGWFGTEGGGVLKYENDEWSLNTFGTNYVSAVSGADQHSTAQLLLGQLSPMQLQPPGGDLSEVQSSKTQGLDSPEARNVYVAAVSGYSNSAESQTLILRQGLGWNGLRNSPQFAPGAGRYSDLWVDQRGIAWLATTSTTSWGTDTQSGQNNRSRSGVYSLLQNNTWIPFGSDEWNSQTFGEFSVSSVAADDQSVWVGMKCHNPCRSVGKEIPGGILRYYQGQWHDYTDQSEVLYVNDIWITPQNTVWLAAAGQLIEVEFVSTTSDTGTDSPAQLESPSLRVEIITDNLNVRSGPGTDYDPPMGQVNTGAELSVLGRNSDGTWLQVCCVAGQPGWVINEEAYLTVSGDVNSLSVVATPVPTPTTIPCTLQIHTEFQELHKKVGGSLVACPITAAAVGQLAYQPFQNGFMIWRPGTSSIAGGTIYVVYNSGRWEAYADEWVDGMPISQGYAPPSGLIEPLRGFGVVWATKLGGPSASIGWALDHETSTHDGLIQDFEDGYVIVQYPDQTPIFMHDGGRWAR